MALFRRQQDSGDSGDSRSKRGGVRRETRIDIDLSELEKRATPDLSTGPSGSGPQGPAAVGGRSTRITTRSMPIGQLLIQAGAANGRQVEAALERQKAHGGLIGQILVSMNACRPDDIAAALGKQFRFTEVDLAAFIANPDALILLTPDKCSELKAIPFERIGKLLCVAVANVLNRKAIKEIEDISGLKVKAFTSTWPAIQAAIATSYTPEIAQAASSLDAARGGGRISLAMAEELASRLGAGADADIDEAEEELEEIDPAEFAKLVGLGSQPKASAPAEIPIPFPTAPDDQAEAEDVPILMDEDVDSMDSMADPAAELPELIEDLEALDEVPELADESPTPEEEAAVYINDATELRSQGRLDEAVKRLEAGAASVSGATVIDNLLAEVRKEAHEKARIENDRLQKVTVLLHAGRAERAKGNLEAAVAKFAEASELDPKNNVLSHELAAAEEELIRIRAEAVAKQKAEEEARRLEAERKAEEDARKHKQIEELLDLVQKARDVGKLEVARSRLQDVLDLDQSNVKAGGQMLEIQALIAARDKQREAEMEAIASAAEMAKQDGGFEAVLARIDALEPTVQREPKIADIRHDMESRLRQRQKAEAAAQAAASERDAAEFAAKLKDILGRAELALQAGKFDEAEGLFEDAVVLDPSNSEAAAKLDATRQDIHRRHEEEEERRKADEERRTREARVREVLRESAQDREAGRLELALRKIEEMQRECPDREDVQKAAELVALDIKLRDEKREQQRLADEARNRKSEDDLKLKAQKAAAAEAEQRRMSAAMGGEKRIASDAITEESLIQLRVTPAALHAGLAGKLSPDDAGAGLDRLPVAQRFARNRQELRSMAEAAKAAAAALEEALAIDDEPEAILEALAEDDLADGDIAEMAEVVAIPETRMAAEAISEDEFEGFRAGMVPDPAQKWALAVGCAGAARALPVEP